ncbi:MAG TPA: hypothetical protein VE090_05985 [Methylomirabilota bacterium]|nr:hypothetical protein [Methylomirabilota bacterium]
MSAKYELSPKEHHWQEFAKRVSLYDPRQPIDLSVRDAVIGLNLLGIKTSSCCGGHRDYRPLQGPYISFWEKAYPTKCEIGDKAYSEKYISVDEIDGYLKEFYLTQRVNENPRLVVYRVYRESKGGIIFNQGNKERILPDEKSRYYDRPSKRVGRRDLSAYKRQMEEFGKFLREKYITSLGENSTPANNF